MAQQGELFPKAEVTIRLDGSRGEPRLWVRRIVLWEKPGEIIRDIPLRRGLNIIWSPDPGAKQAELGLDAGSGHGAGKTLFCRLLRYCLGEDTFSNDGQRRSIVELLPAGLVGVEVVIDGKLWAVIRPIGQTRKHVAREGATTCCGSYVLARTNRELEPIKPTERCAVNETVPRDSRLPLSERATGACQ